MNVNGCHEIDDASPETVELLADLIEASRTEEQMVYREAELDELWRWIGAGRTGDVAIPAEKVQSVLDEVHAVHDLIEQPENARAAAERLRGIKAFARVHQP